MKAIKQLLISAFVAVGVFANSNSQKNDSYSQQSTYNQKPCIQINEHCICHISYLLSSHTARIKKMIARIRSYVKKKSFPGAFRDIKLGRTIINPKSPADIFVQNPDKTLNQDFLALNNLFAENFITITISQ